MKTIERPDFLKEEHLEYLDTLRETGVTNMLGAGVFLEEQFGVNKKDAAAILKYWIKTFHERKIEGEK